MTIDDFQRQADRCSRLAKVPDPSTERRLLDLAMEYELRIAQMQKGYRPSAASRLLKGDA